MQTWFPKAASSIPIAASSWSAALSLLTACTLGELGMALQAVTSLPQQCSTTLSSRCFLGKVVVEHLLAKCD